MNSKKTILSNFSASKPFLATLSGLVAILMWSSLAVASNFVHRLPRFELLWLSFGVAFLIGTVILTIRGQLHNMVQPFVPWVIGFFGIFLFHLFYFIGIALAPPAKVTLISYLWPMMLVVASAFVERKQFRITYLIGAIMGFGGTLLLMSGDVSIRGNSLIWWGYISAFICAVTWTAYSIANRRYTNIPSEMLVGVCGAISIVTFLIHICVEKTVMPTFPEIAVICFLGIGPTGTAFLFWDYASKYANLSLLGSLSYLAPMLSTLWLVLGGVTLASWGLLAAVFLIVGGAAIATIPINRKT